MRSLQAGLWVVVIAVIVPGRSNAAPAQAAGITVAQNVALGGKHCDQVTWTDANGKARSIWLVRADGDPGYSGGYIDQYTYYIDGAQKTGKSDATQPGVAGLGCAVNHHSSASVSKANSSGASTGIVFQGPNHLLWRFHSTYSGDGSTVGLTIDWLITQGRNDVLWAVSYDATGQATFNWDARGPYFQFDWDGDGHFYDGAISGIRWGDKYKFKTTSYSGTTSAWDYTQPNTIPYMTTWKNASIGDLEAGVVQTQTWAQQDSAGYWWAASHWGQTGTGMMENWNCPYQLNSYEGYAGEKMAWGTSFGFVGNPAYARVDGTTAVGSPHQGYSTYIILNKFSDGLTDAMINSMAAVQGATLTTSQGTVVTSGPRHANLTGNATYQPAGWNHVNGTWALTAAASNQAAFNVSIPSGTIVRPTFVIGNYTAAAPATITLNGATLTGGTDYYASVDSTNQKLWLTLGRNLTGATNGLSLAGSGAPPPAPAPAPPPPPAPPGGGGGTPAASSGGGGGGGHKCGCNTASAPSPLLGVLAAFALLPFLRRRSGP